MCPSGLCTYKIQAIILVNIRILEVTDTFLPFFVSPNKCNNSKNRTFLHSVNVKQDAEGIQNMSGIYLIGIFSIK